MRIHKNQACFFEKWTDFTDFKFYKHISLKEEHYRAQKFPLRGKINLSLKVISDKSQVMNSGTIFITLTDKFLSNYLSLQVISDKYEVINFSRTK